MKAEHTRKVLEEFKQTPVNESLRDLEIFIVQMMNAIIADMEAGEVMTNAHPDGNGTVCTGYGCKMCEGRNHEPLANL